MWFAVGRWRDVGVGGVRDERRVGVGLRAKILH